MTHTLRLAAAADLSRASIDITAVLDHLVREADATAATSIGFPGAVDLDHTEVMTRLGGRLWNNIGDPADEGGIAHTRALERAVITWTADLLAMPADDRWGYVTTGGTEGTLSALHAAHRRKPTARIYYSAAAHYSVAKVVRLLGAHGILVHARPDGEMDYAHLAEQLHRRRRFPAIVVATAGTTMTEAVDDTSRIRADLEKAGQPKDVARKPLDLHSTRRFSRRPSLAGVEPEIRKVLMGHSMGDVTEDYYTDREVEQPHEAVCRIISISQREISLGFLSQRCPPPLDSDHGHRRPSGSTSRLKIDECTKSA